STPKIQVQWPIRPVCRDGAAAKRGVGFCSRRNSDCRAGDSVTNRVHKPTMKVCRSSLFRSSLSLFGVALAVGAATNGCGPTSPNDPQGNAPASGGASGAPSSPSGGSSGAAASGGASGSSAPGMGGRGGDGAAGTVGSGGSGGAGDGGGGAGGSAASAGGGAGGAGAANAGAGGASAGAGGGGAPSNGGSAGKGALVGTIADLEVEANPNSVLSAYVRWTTAEPSSSVVQFGEGELTWEIEGAGNVTEHEVLVIGMRAQTTYQIRALSTGASGTVE